MQKIVGIRFREAGKIYYFDPLQIFLKVGEHVIAETARGLEYGQVASKVRFVEESELKHPLKPILRKATQKDDQAYELNLQKAESALDICQQQVEKHKLQMKLIRAEYTFDASKVVFYFSADGRVDFRELVKDLAAIFRIRIELRQIGVRDEAKIVGGIGVCGRDLCCNKWMGDFSTVSIKMAKEQGLSLNPGKISGICGRLLCCLQYEHDCYEYALGVLPDIGQSVKTPDGIGNVVRLEILKEKVWVNLPDAETIKVYPRDQITQLGAKKHRKNQKKEDADAALAADELKELKQLSSDEGFKLND